MGLILLCGLQHVYVFAQCPGLKADAGPDVIICKKEQQVQLQGTVQGNYSKYYWTPTFGLSDPTLLNPDILLKNPGQYTYKLIAEGHTNQNLIINGDFENGNKGFTTNYQLFSLPGWIPTGYYAVDSDPAPYYIPEFQNCVDHTSGAGKMMIVNGAVVGGLDVWCQTISVKPNTDYHFECYFTSLYPTAPSTIRISFNGTPIHTEQLSSVTCDWIKYEASWNSGSSSSLSICMQNMNYIGWGNDFAIDDIGLFEKCFDTDEVKVDVVHLNANVDISLKPKCSSDTLVLSGLGSSTGSRIRYQWSTDIGKIISQNGLTAKARGSGTYTLKVSYSNGNLYCEEEASIEYQAPEELSGSLLQNGMINCKQDSSILHMKMNRGSGSYAFEWSLDSNRIMGVYKDSIWIRSAGTYRVTVTDLQTHCMLAQEMDVKSDTLKPKAQISGEHVIDCLHPTVMLRSESTDTSAYFNVWITPDSATFGNKISIQASEAGFYQLFVTDLRNFCEDTTEWEVRVDTLAPLLELGSDLIIDCLQDSVTIRNLLTNPGSGFTYQWMIDNMPLQTEMQYQDKFIDSSSFIRLRIVNDTNGCSAIDSIQIWDNRKLPVFQLAPTDTLTCIKNQVQLQAIVNPTDSFLFEWSTRSGRILSDNHIVNPLVGSSAWYNIKVTNPANGCVKEDSLFVNEDKQVPIAVSGPDGVFQCKDSLVEIDGSLSRTGPQYSFQWFSADGQIHKILNGGHKILIAGPGHYRLIVVDLINGCSDTALSIFTEDLDKPKITILTPDTLTCKNKLVSIIASASSANGNALKLSWKGPAGSQIDSLDTPECKAPIPGLYQLTATDTVNGCQTLAQTVVHIDTLNPVSDAGPDVRWICGDTILVIHGITPDSSEKYTFHWNTVNGLIAGNPDDSTITATSPGQYKLRLENKVNGCWAVDSMTIIADTTAPRIHLESHDILSCSRLLVTVSSVGSRTGIQSRYLWQSPDGHISGNSSGTEIQVDQPGTYTLHITDTSNYCSARDSIIIFADLVKPVINFLPAAILNCKTKSVELIAAYRSAGPDPLFHWTTQNGSILSGEHSDHCIAEKAGMYRLKITNPKNGCETEDSIALLEDTNIPTDFTFKIQQPLCPGDSGTIELLQTSGGQQPLRYLLDGIPVNAPRIEHVPPGIHHMLLADANDCSVSKDIFVETPSSITVQLPQEAFILPGTAYTMNPLFSIPPDSIAWMNWSPPEFLNCSDCPNPSVSGLSEDTQFMLQVSSSSGCITKASILIHAFQKKIWIPNAFSPNGDQINDLFYPSIPDGSYTRIRNFLIYNRWGEEVYRKNDIQHNTMQSGWDGRFSGQQASPGVYVYLIEVEWNDGTTEKFSGDLNLIR